MHKNTMGTHEKGITMIEILVGTLLGALIIIMCVKSFQTTRSTEVMTRASTEIQVEARAALSALKYNIEHTGFYADFGIDAVNVNFPAGNGFAQGQVIQVRKDSSGDNQLLLRLTGDPSINQLDCAGNIIIPGELAVMNFFVNDDEMLICDRVGSGLPGVIIAKGIDAMQIRLGMDTNNDNKIDTFATADDTPALAQLDVMSVELELVFKSNTWVFVSDRAQSFTLLNDVVLDVNDRFLHRSFEEIFLLKNSSKIY